MFGKDLARRIYSHSSAKKDQQPADRERGGGGSEDFKSDGEGEKVE